METQTEDGREAYHQLSNIQDSLLAILPIPSAILSIFGSFVILIMAFKSRRKTHWTPYHGLLAGISLTNIIFSITLAAGNFLYPQETSNRVWAFGNEATCDTIGFFNQFSYSAMLYMTMLSFYFVLSIRHNCSDDEIANKYETKWHLICLGWPLLSAFAALYLDFYGEREVNMGCWIRTSIPKNCGPDGSGEKCRGRELNLFFGNLPMFICLIILIVNNARIWKYVRKKAEVHTERLSIAANGGDGERTGTTAQSDRALRRFAETQKHYQERLEIQRSQAFYFVGSFFCCNIITYALRTMEVWEDSPVALKEMSYRTFPLLVLQAILYPLQGFANMVVWLRPSYSRFRANFPSESKFWCFRQAVFADHVESMGRKDKSNLTIKETKGSTRMERKKTAMSSSRSIGCGVSTGALSQKDSSILDSLDEKRIPKRDASIVMMDGSIYVMGSSEESPSSKSRAND